MLGTLPPNKKSSWRDMVPMLVHAYTCTRSTAMGFSPYYLYFGTQRADINAITSSKFVQQLRETKVGI